MQAMRLYKFHGHSSKNSFVMVESQLSTIIYHLAIILILNMPQKQALRRRGWRCTLNIFAG